MFCGEVSCDEGHVSLSLPRQCHDLLDHALQHIVELKIGSCLGQHLITTQSLHGESTCFANFLLFLTQRDVHG